jgi:tellurium resistance protein TerD
MHMTLSLSKGEKLSLAKVAPALKHMVVGLGWTARATAGVEFDLDASAFLLNKDGKCRSDADFIFYGQKKSTCGSVESMGDNRTGTDGVSDAEQILVNLTTLPADVDKIDFTVTIYDFIKRQQTFGQVNKAYIRLVDGDTNAEVCRYDLSEDSSTETAMVFAQLYRKDAGWSFNAVGQGYSGGLKELAGVRGVVVGD